MSIFRNKSTSLSKVLQMAGIENPVKNDLDAFVSQYKDQIGEMWQGFISKSKDEQDESVAVDHPAEEISSEYVKVELHQHEIDNASVNQLYETYVSLPDDGIVAVKINPCDHFTDLIYDTQSSKIKGLPLKEGDTEILLEYQVRKQIKLKLYVNEDPKNLWNDIPSDQENKADNVCKFEKFDGLDIISASRRGRSHANKGTARDDHFKYDTFNEWIISAVSDGMGSAKLSNLGSKVICETIVEEIKVGLERTNEKMFQVIQNASPVNDANDTLRELLYEILVKSAHKAYIAMTETAKERNISVSDLSSTLSVAIVRNLGESKFVAGFQVGDGLIASYAPDKVNILCKIDRGEYKGQTKPLNSLDVFSGAENLVNRIYFTKVQSNAAILLMTDGIVDPYFDNDDDNLIKLTYWGRLWEEIEKESLLKENPAESLLEWLNFYQEGEHDDRTITIIK